MFCIVSLSRTGGFDILCRHTAPDFMRSDLCVLQHQGPSSDNGPFAYLTAIQQGGPHANEGMVVNGAGMHGDIMSDGDIAANMRGSRLVSHMDAGTILYIGAVANGDRRHVAPHYSIEPYRTLIAHGDIPHDGGVLTEIAVLAPFGRQTAIAFD